jgi:hypothetical protein
MNWSLGWRSVAGPAGTSSRKSSQETSRLLVLGISVSAVLAVQNRCCQVTKCLPMHGNDLTDKLLYLIWYIQLLGFMSNSYSNTVKRFLLAEKHCVHYYSYKTFPWVCIYSVMNLWCETHMKKEAEITQNIMTLTNCCMFECMEWRIE